MHGYSKPVIDHLHLVWFETELKIHVETELKNADRDSNLNSIIFY